MDAICDKEPEGEPLPALFCHEWISILAISLFLLFLSVVSLLEDHSSIDTSQPYLPKPIVKITVTGAVVQPGTYEVPQGTFLREVLERAQPLPRARLDHLKVDQKLQRSRKVHVPRSRKNNLDI